MNTVDQTTRAGLDNQTFALMGRLYVALRRGGRVTDIEYMRIDADYCRHVLALAAASDNEDLRQIGLKLEAIYFGENGLFVLQAREAAAAERVLDDLMMPAGTKEAEPAEDRPYIGRLR